MMKGALVCPLQAIKMEDPIPITIAVTHDTYCSLFAQGLLAGHLREAICPRYPHNCCAKDLPPAVELTNCTVDRKAFILEKDDYGIDTVMERKVDIVLARCPKCKGRCRVLPVDILPYKLYSLPVIELSVSLYNRGDLSLRQVAWDQLYGERTPEHTTLHGWTEGLGAWYLGRSTGEVAVSVPATRVLAELEIRFPQMKSLHSIPVRINPLRYRSQGRRERLEACKRFQMIGTMLKGKNIWKLVDLNSLIVSWGNSLGLGFKTAICCTPIEHIDSTDVRSWRQMSKKEPLSCLIHGRSPPGDSK
jgi:hypothetical protein